MVANPGGLQQRTDPMRGKKPGPFWQETTPKASESRNQVVISVQVAPPEQRVTNLREKGQGRRTTGYKSKKSRSNKISNLSNDGDWIVVGSKNRKPTPRSSRTSKSARNDPTGHRHANAHKTKTSLPSQRKTYEPKREYAYHTKTQRPASAPKNRNTKTAARSPRNMDRSAAYSPRRFAAQLAKKNAVLRATAAVNARPPYRSTPSKSPWKKQSNVGQRVSDHLACKNCSTIPSASRILTLCHLPFSKYVPPLQKENEPNPPVNQTRTNPAP